MPEVRKGPQARRFSRGWLGIPDCFGEGRSGLGSLIAGVVLDAIRFPADIARRGLEPHLAPATAHGLGWISGPLPAVITALCILPLLIYSLDQEKCRVIKQALSERSNATTREGLHR